MSVGRPRRHSSGMDEVDEDGNVLWHGVKLGEFWKTDMQVAINDSNRRQDASFTIRIGRTGTTPPYQQPIPADFARYHNNLCQESITLQGPTGHIWSTVLNPSYQVVRFGRGWRQFSVENHLQEGYQLLFTLTGKFRLLVQFFDHLGKRCTSYPPLPGSLSAAETQRQPDLQPGSQQVVDGGQASRRHGSEDQTSAAIPLMGTTANSAIPLRQYAPEVAGLEASLPHEHLRVPTFETRNDSEDTETEDEETEALAEDTETEDEETEALAEDTETEDEETEALAEDINYIFLESDNDDDVLFCHPLATKPPVKKTKCNQANRPQVQRSNSPSSDDELPDLQKKVTAKRRSLATPPVAGSHNAGASSGSSPAMRLMQQQGCMRFSDIVSKCQRRDVIVKERREVLWAAKRFASKLGNEKFLVVMRDAQVYQGFHLAIPGKILAVTGTEHMHKVEVCLVDREQALYKAHWTRQNFHDTPLLDRDAWAKFAVDHTLEEGDVCVFQLLPQLPLQSKPVVSVATFLLCVHIFRIVDTPS